MSNWIPLIELDPIFTGSNVSYIVRLRRTMDKLSFIVSVFCPLSSSPSSLVQQSYNNSAVISWKQRIMKGQLLLTEMFSRLALFYSSSIYEH